MLGFACGTLSRFPGRRRRTFFGPAPRVSLASLLFSHLPPLSLRVLCRTLLFHLSLLSPIYIYIDYLILILRNLFGL